VIASAEAHAAVCRRRRHDHRDRPKTASPQGAVQEGRGGDRPSWCAPRSLWRDDGTYIAFDENAAVLIDAQNTPAAPASSGPVARELRERNFMKIVSLAPEVPLVARRAR